MIEPLRLAILDEFEGGIVVFRRGNQVAALLDLIEACRAGEASGKDERQGCDDAEHQPVRQTPRIA